MHARQLCHCSANQPSSPANQPSSLQPSSLQPSSLPARQPPRQQGRASRFAISAADGCPDGGAPAQRVLHARLRPALALGCHVHARAACSAGVAIAAVHNGGQKEIKVMWSATGQGQMVHGSRRGTCSRSGPEPINQHTSSTGVAAPAGAVRRRVRDAMHGQHLLAHTSQQGGRLI